jgi:CheY-like chemotaxis protein
VVEDDEDIREAIVDAFHLHGFAVLAAGDGAEALAMLDAFKPDVILLDLMMPVMDGYGFLSVRAARPEIAAIPVVVASAGPRRPELAASPWNEFIAKPFEVDRLVDVVERLCNLHRSISG